MDVMYTSARRPLELSYESHRQGGLEYVVGMGPPERIVGMGPERVPGMGPERVPGMGPERVPGMGPERVPGMGPERGTGMGLERMVGIPYSAQPPRTGYNQPNAGGPYTRERLVQPQVSPVWSGSTSFFNAPTPPPPPRTSLHILYSLRRSIWCVPIGLHLRQQMEGSNLSPSPIHIFQLLSQ